MLGVGAILRPRAEQHPPLARLRDAHDHGTPLDVQQALEHARAAAHDAVRAAVRRQAEDPARDDLDAKLD